MKNIILSFICLIAFVSSCSKYDDGPAFSLLTKTQRVTGTWTLTKVIVNGEEISPDDTYTYTGNYTCYSPTGGWTEHTYDLIESDSYEITWEFEKDGDFSHLEYSTSNFQTLDSFSCVNYQAYISNNITNSTNSTYADWEFSSDKLELEIDYGGTSQDFEIARLTNKEMTLEQKYEGIKTEYQFEKQ